MVPPSVRRTTDGVFGLSGQMQFVVTRVSRGVKRSMRLV